MNTNIKMKHQTISTLCIRSICVLVLLAGVSAGADWQQVAPGIEYAEMTLPGPVDVFVARADRTNQNWTMDAMMAKGSAKGAREIVPDMAARRDDAVNFRGERYDVKVAVNGSYFNPRTGVPFGGQIVGGWFVRRFDEYSGGSGLFWTLDRRLEMGGNVRNGAKWQQVSFAGGEQMNIHKLNDPRGQDELAMYTWQYAERTDSVEPGVEVVVRMSAPVGIMPEKGGVPGEIISVRKTSGGTPLLYDHVVLSGQGQAAEKLLQLANPGEQLRINLTLTDYANEDIGLKAPDWKQAYGTIPAATYILVDGNIPRHWEAKAKRLAAEGKRHGSVVKDPRTVIAFNDRYLYFIVIDGRAKRSIGMNFTEAAEFCKNRLEAENAVTIDGGGSSTMWVDGKVRNRYTDRNKAGEPVLRPVANGLLIAVLEPAEKSDMLAPGASMQTSESVELRRGPGSHFEPLADISGKTRGTVLDHPLTGIKAKGDHWWLCRLGGQEGWLPQSALQK